MPTDTEEVSILFGNEYFTFDNHYFLGPLFDFKKSAGRIRIFILISTFTFLLHSKMYKNKKVHIIELYIWDPGPETRQILGYSYYNTDNKEKYKYVKQ